MEKGVDGCWQINQRIRLSCERIEHASPNVKPSKRVIHAFLPDQSGSERTRSVSFPMIEQNAVTKVVRPG
jgi:hypothetical protein